MQLPLALNTISGSALIVVLIFADYIRKYNTGHTQRTVFCGMLVCVFIPMISDMAAFLINGKPDSYAALYAIKTVQNIFQVLAYYFLVLFIDLMIYKDRERVKKIAIGVYIITAVHIALLLVNLKWHYYFYIDQARNIFCYGDKYYIHLVISYVPVVFAFYELAASRGMFRKFHLLTLFLLLGLTSAGSWADVLLGSVKLIWPCMTAALLYCYFFIIQTDTRIDSLTGIGNRYSFNEFTDHLSRHKSGESWAIVMIDMDHFKRINDTLGHQEGDNALRDMAAIIKNCVKSSDFAARYGGDEFVLATKTDGMTSLMGRIQAAIDRQNEQHIRPFKIEISYGHDVFTADGTRKIEEFLNHIDSLMYKQKEERRRASDRQGAAL
jgi:diguanylate cyclase (GGDEF)-like protein